jgi:hypothetical protein
VQQSDIDSVVQPVKMALAQSGQASLKTQILANERLIGPVQCVSNIASDHHCSAERFRGISCSKWNIDTLFQLTSKNSN